MEIPQIQFLDRVLDVLVDGHMDHSCDSISDFQMEVVSKEKVCEIIDDCGLVNACRTGDCVDKVNGYTCDCDEHHELIFQQSQQLQQSAAAARGLARCPRYHPAWVSVGTPVGPSNDTHGTLGPGQREGRGWPMRSDSTVHSAETPHTFTHFSCFMRLFLNNFFRFFIFQFFHFFMFSF